MSKANAQVIELFNCCVIGDDQKRVIDHTLTLKNGVVTNFHPTNYQAEAIKSIFKKINITTLFGKKERLNDSIDKLIIKQLLHYVEVYGLDNPGLFELEVTKGKILPIAFIRGISKEELTQKIHTLIYANAPIKDVALVCDIINNFDIQYNFEDIANHELRIQLFDWTRHTFTNGDDVVRYLCYRATDKTLLIKSDDVVQAVGRLKIDPKFITNHEIPLAQVFNRHKRLILAIKNNKNSSAINKVSRLSKKHHVPIRPSVKTHFVTLALNKKINVDVLGLISIRDKFKYLNLLEYKKQQFSDEIFVIRNGRVHFERDRPTYSTKRLNEVINAVKESLKNDLSHLKNLSIVVDKDVDFGLPISRKQTFGRVPFGTVVKIPKGQEISAGIHWRNEWGARDLDLSAIDHDGNRTGWGQYSGYDNDNSIIYSGDVTHAEDGAMEFMTSSDAKYGLLVNLYSGDIGAGFELVVGTGGKNKWIKDVVFREKGSLPSRGAIVGFVDDNKFVVFNTQITGSRVSWGSGPKMSSIVHRGTGKFWTVRGILDLVGVDYHTTRKKTHAYDIDLTYDQFSYDQLEHLFYDGEKIASTDLIALTDLAI